VLESVAIVPFTISVPTQCLQSTLPTYRYAGNTNDPVSAHQLANATFSNLC